MAEKRIVDYTGLTILDVEELDVVSYRSYLRDAMIFLYSSTEEGREYLRNCWRIGQTKPDRKHLAERFGSGGDVNR